MKLEFSHISKPTSTKLEELLRAPELCTSFSVATLHISAPQNIHIKTYESTYLTQAAASPPIYDLASLTKPFVALTVSSLVQDGLLGWDESIEAGIAELKDSALGGLSFRELLSHRAGLPGHIAMYTSAEASWRVASAVDRQKIIEDLPRSIDESRFLKILLEVYDPKQRGQATYSDLGYALVGIAIERRFQRCLEDLREERWLKEATDFNHFVKERGSVEALCRRFSQPHFIKTEDVDWRGGTIVGAVHDENAWLLKGTALCGHAGLFGSLKATAELVAGVLTAARGDLTLRAQQWISDCLIQSPDSSSLRCGFDGKSLGHSVAGASCSQDTYGHLGFTGTSFWIDPKREQAVILLSNRVYPNRYNEGFAQVRPVVHELLWTELSHG